MAQSQNRSGFDRLVRLTPEAEDDRILAYLDTEQIWGTIQANNYDNFLLGIIQNIAEYPNIGSIVENVEGVRRYCARWKDARNGHNIFYEETGDEILILRILHSSMNWPDYLGDA